MQQAASPYISEHSSSRMAHVYAELGIWPLFGLTAQDRTQAAVMRRSLQAVEGGHAAFPVNTLAIKPRFSFPPAVKATTSNVTTRDEAHLEYSSMWQVGLPRLPGLQHLWSLHVNVHSGTCAPASAAPHSYALHDVEEWVEEPADEQLEMNTPAEEQQDAADKKQQLLVEDMADQQPPSESERSSAGALSKQASINTQRRMQARRNQHVRKATSRPIKLQFTLALQSPTMMGGAGDDSTSSCTGSAQHSVYNTSSEEDGTSSSNESAPRTASYQEKVAAEMHTGSPSRDVPLPTGRDATPTFPL